MLHFFGTPKQVLEKSVLIELINVLYFNEKKLRYDLEDTPRFSNATNKASLNHVPISQKEWVL